MKFQSENRNQAIYRKAKIFEKILVVSANVHIDKFHGDRHCYNSTQQFIKQSKH